MEAVAENLGLHLGEGAGLCLFARDGHTVAQEHAAAAPVSLPEWVGTGGSPIAAGRIPALSHPGLFVWSSRVSAKFPTA